MIASTVFLLTFSRAPMRFFGGLGLVSLLLSGMTFLWLLWLWLAYATQRRPFFWAAIGLATLAKGPLGLEGYTQLMRNLAINLGQCLGTP